MKAVVYEQYGSADVLQIKEIEKPIPRMDQVLIKVLASSVTAADWRMRRADPFLARLFNGLLRPKKVNVLGIEISGIIEEVGIDVKSFSKGDMVFALCGFKFGGYAEYHCLPETSIIALKPSNMTFEEAATTPLGSLTALTFLRKGGIGEGKKVLIYGASGSVGTFAIQIANSFGAETVAVCSGSNIPLMKRLGATETIDYTKEDFSKSNKQFDIIFDAVGKIKKSDCKYILKPNGKYVSVKQQSNPKKEDLIVVKNLVETGKLISVIDHIYDINEIKDAHKYVEQFRKKGNVGIRMTFDSTESSVVGFGQN